LLDVFTHFEKEFNTNTPDPARKMVHAQIKLLLARSVELEEIIDANKSVYRWPENICERFLECTFELCALQRAVSNWCSEQQPPIAMFNVTIKSHMLIHCALYSFGINPVMVWNYMGEDYMKRIKKLTAQNAVATNWLNVNAKVIEQYVRGMDLFLQDESAGYFR
jgi:hypothetical protein